MTEKRDSIGTQEIKKMMAITGIFAPDDSNEPPTAVGWKNAGGVGAEKRERSESPRNAASPSALTSLAFFSHHLLMNAIPKPLSGASATTARGAISDQFAWFPISHGGGFAQ